MALAAAYRRADEAHQADSQASHYGLDKSLFIRKDRQATNKSSPSNAVTCRGLPNNNFL